MLQNCEKRHRIRVYSENKKQETKPQLGMKFENTIKLLSLILR